MSTIATTSGPILSEGRADHSGGWRSPAQGEVTDCDWGLSVDRDVLRRALCQVGRSEAVALEIDRDGKTALIYRDEKRPRGIRLPKGSPSTPGRRVMPVEVLLRICRASDADIVFIQDSEEAGTLRVLAISKQGGHRITGRWILKVEKGAALPRLAELPESAFDDDPRPVAGRTQKPVPIADPWADPTIREAMRLWCRNQCYLGTDGHYRLWVKGRIAPWNRLVKDHFPVNARFDAEARKMFPDLVNERTRCHAPIPIHAAEFPAPKPPEPVIVAKLDKAKGPKPRAKVNAKRTPAPEQAAEPTAKAKRIPSAPVVAVAAKPTAKAPAKVQRPPAVIRPADTSATNIVERRRAAAEKATATRKARWAAADPVALAERRRQIMAKAAATRRANTQAAVA